MRINSKVVKRPLLVLTLILMTAGAVFAGGSTESAETKKTRLNVGWTEGQSIESTIVDENWQYVEMGCMLWQLCYDQLWIMGDAEENYSVKPMVAESWDVSDDMKTWTFHLRHDVKFNDGTPLTAEDVEFTFEYLPKSDPAWDMSDFEYESVKVIDDYTIEFTMVNTFGMPYLPMYWGPILPKHLWEPYKDDMKSYPNEHMIGSGPYSVKEFKAGQYVWLEANENYWGGKPGVDEIVFKIFGTEDARNMALKKGEIDMLGYLGISPLTLESFEGIDGIDIIVTPGLNLQWLNFNLHKDSGISDVAVRKAIMHSLDIDRIIDMSLLGYADPADSLVYKELDWYNDDVTRYPYDTAKAKSILDAAGYTDTDGDGIRNEKNGSGNMVYELLISSDYADDVKAAKIISEMCGEIGIKVDLKFVDQDTFYNFIYAPEEDQFDIALSADGPGPNGEWFWDYCRGWENGGAGWNTAYYNSAEFDTAMDNMLAAGSLEEKNMYRKQMQKIISEDLPYGVIFRPQVISPVNSKDFTGYTPTMGGISTWVNPWTFYNIKTK